MRYLAVALASLLLAPSLWRSCPAQHPAALDSPEHAHSNPEWANIAEHLPDPATASPAALEMAGDTLRARRYPQDAFQFYRAAIARGGDPRTLLDKMGIACLELQQITLARALFDQAVHLNRKNAPAWNNLGAAEFILHNTGGAIHDYKRAVKLQRGSAVFHSNLALAYFDARETEDARRELSRALTLDPNLLHRAGDNGYTAQVLASQQYPEICFEMARIYAAQGDIEAVLDWLTKASERGFDVRSAMDRDSTLRPLLADERVRTILKNQQVLRAKFKVPQNVPGLGNAER